MYSSYVGMLLCMRRVRSDFTSTLVHGLAFGIPKFCIAPYDKLIILNDNLKLGYKCDVKSGLNVAVDGLK